MALETGTYISDLNSSNPQSTDSVSQADDHLRLIKAAVKATFPNITGPVTKTQAEINGLAPLASPTFTGTPAAPTASPGTDTTQVATTAFVKSAVDTSAALKADKTTTVTAGTGLSGGGDLSTNRTLSITAGGVGTTQLADSSVTSAKLASGAAVSNIGYTPVNPSVFTGDNQSLATSGYQKLPGGLIIQWGSADTASGSGGSYTVTWPTAFTTACVAVTANITTSGSLRGIFVTAKSTTSGTFYTRNNTDSTNAPFNWIAIGY